MADRLDAVNASFEDCEEQDGGTLTTTYHIQGAGAPAKTKNYVNADAFIFFREKVRPFPHLAKPISRTFRKDEKSNGTDKKRLV